MIQVCCAVIIESRAGQPTVLVCQRSSVMRLPLKWEFPGGKLEPLETLEACLKRELQEELGIQVEVLAPLAPVIHDYGSGSIQLNAFMCRIVAGAVQLTEHKRYCWQPLPLLLTLDLAEADIPIVHQLLKHEGRSSIHGAL